MKCDVVTCAHNARYIYTASLSNRRFYGCEYHIAPFRKYESNGATIERIVTAKAEMRRCSHAERQSDTQ